VPKFELDSAFSPTADQPAAIVSLAEGIEAGERFQTLLGATGTGKTMTMAATIEAVQRPSLIIAHNKTLAAQLCNEFRTYFPSNSVEYFVSYYDYYQPEAYVPSKDLYIEKDSAINQEIDRLRHAATAGLFARRDVVIVASVSCIFGLGSPEVYDENLQTLNKGEMIDRDRLLRKLVSIQYTRNDTALSRGTFRVRGETLEIFPAYAETAYRIVLFGDEVEHLQHFDPVTGELIEDDLEHVAIWPASHYNVREGMIDDAVAEIGRELNARCTELEAEGKLLESHRLRQRTQYDMEMLRELGFCSGIENYSRILDGRNPGDRPYCLLDYFPDDFVCFLDESHQTVPQIGGMYEGDRSRKQTLVDYGFRLPSALDNRPQTFAEFLSITPQMVFVSATPGQYERAHSPRIVEQIVRPTGIIDPDVEVRETRNQIDPRHHPHQEDVGGPHGLPAGDGLQGPLPALRDRHPGADPDHPRAPARRIRRARRRQPPARGARPPRGIPGGDPGRRQGGLPARRDLAHPDDRAGGAQQPGQGPDVRRQGDRGDAGGAR
jgi:excinuclease ABC subunit B